MNSRYKKRTVRITTVLLALGLLIGGTLAWNDFSQHATNPFRGGQGTRNYSVTLNDRFDPVHNWKVNDTVSKTVSVINLAESNDEVFVRLSLKEFMQTRAQSEGFITDADGNQILFATFAEEPRIGEFLTMEDADTVFKELGGHRYGSYDVKTGEDQYGNPLYTTYATTNSTEIRNGIYGKPMPIPGEIDTMWGTPLSGDVAHTVQSNAECDYEPYLWNKTGALSDEENPDDRTGIRDYISFGQGAEIIQLGDWVGPFNVDTGEPDTDPEWGQFWIVDPVEGWAYWGAPLAPGTTTADFISSVTLNHSPLGDMEGSFDYFMHIDMQVIGGAWAEFQNEITRFYNEDAPNWYQTRILLDLMADFVLNRSELEPIGSINEIFKDENAQKIVATVGLPQAGGDTNYVITQRDVDNVRDKDWQNIFSQPYPTPENEKIESLEGIQHFVNLTGLYLDNNKLTDEGVQPLGKLTNLTSLLLDANRLGSLPEEIGNLTNLTNLRLSHNQLTSLPDWLWNMANLEILYLGSNPLKTLPDGIGNLTNLKGLDVNETGLTSLSNISDTLVQQLTHIFFSNNHISIVPESFQMQNLLLMQDIRAGLQTITLSEQQSDGTLTLDNPIFALGDPVPPRLGSISHDGIYHADTNQIIWEDLPYGTSELSFDFYQNIPIALMDPFSGTVTVQLQQ